jgi:hypothetical protein
MPSPDANRQFLFDAILAGREGAQCERSLRALSYIFHGWAHYRGPRKLFYGEELTGELPIIEFEKLASFWCRIWRRLGLSGSRGKVISAPAVEAPPQVTFPPPFVLERAKHGKRPQRYDISSGPIPLADILYRQQQTEFSKRYFDIRLAKGRARDDPSDYTTRVHTAIPEGRRTQLLTNFTQVEREFLLQLDEIVRRLGALELRAIGTHENANETLADIELEFQDIQPLLTNIEGKLDDLNACQPLAQELLEYADEAYRKGVTNRAEYETAYNLFVTDVKDPTLKTAFLQCQAPPAAIWDTDQMKALSARAGRVYPLANFLVSICYFGLHVSDRSNQRTRLARQMKHHWDEGVKGLKEKKLMNVPETISAIFEKASNQLNPKFREQLVLVVKQVRK